MSHCIYVSLYAAVEAHKKEFENSVKQALFNALKDMSPADIKNAFSPMAQTNAIYKVAA